MQFSGRGNLWDPETLEKGLSRPPSIGFYSHYVFDVAFQNLAKHLDGVGRDIHILL